MCICECVFKINDAQGVHRAWGQRQEINSRNKFIILTYIHTHKIVEQHVAIKKDQISHDATWTLSSAVGSLAPAPMSKSSSLLLPRLLINLPWHQKEQHVYLERNHRMEQKDLTNHEKHISHSFIDVMRLFMVYSWEEKEMKNC